MDKTTSFKCVVKNVKLAAAVFHHAALVYLGLEALDDAKIMANRSMRLREQSKDENGISFGLSLLSHIAKQQIRNLSGMPCITLGPGRHA